jgi:hypothetical protein
VIINLRCRRLYTRIAACVIVLLNAAVLAGCMPDFNWRDVRFDEQHLVLTLPAKPDAMTRTIDLNGSKVSMTMNGVNIKDLSYTVGWVALPDSSNETRDKILGAMQLGMVRNLSGTVVASDEIKIALIDTAGKGAGSVVGRRVVASGKAPTSSNKEPIQLNAVFVAHRQWAFQIVAIGSESAFKNSAASAESAKQFLESVRLVQ